MAEDREAPDEHSENPDEENGNTFQIKLGFAGAACPQCGEIAAPGTCPNCGAEVPASTETNALVEARQKALGPLTQRAAQLLVGLESLPQGRVPVSADQFLAAVTDAELFTRVGEMGQLGHRLAEIDFDDLKAVGKDARRIVSSQLDRVVELQDVCQELALFLPEGPASELQEIALQAGRYGAQIVDLIVRIVTASNIPEAKKLETELQELLSGFPPGERLDEVLPLVSDWATPDTDSRIGLALDQPGSFSDDFGFPDPARIFASFADVEQPFIALAERARRYFSHLLRKQAADSGIEALLVLPMITLATLDRPALGHRISVQLVDLMRRAWAADPEAVSELVERTTAQGPLVFAAASRVQKGLLLLTRGDQAGLVDDETALKEILDAYLGLTESQFRTLGWLVLDLIGVTKGESIAESDQAPMLAELEQRLSASDVRLARGLAACSDSALRNAAGHAQYRWEPTTQRLIDLRTGNEWSLEKLEERVEAIAGSLAGLDAGYSCFLVDGEIELQTPEWLRAGEAPLATSLLAQAVFGAFGYTVVSVTPDGSEVALEPADEIDRLRLMLPTAGMAAVFSQKETMRVTDSVSGQALLEVSTDALANASAAKEDVRDLAVLIPVLDAAERAGSDRTEALLDMLATQVAVIVITALPDIQAGSLDRAPMLLLARRLGYVHGAARTHSGSADKRARKLLERLGRAQGSAMAAAGGDSGAVQRLAQQLAGLLQWVEARGIRWPPL